MVPSDTPIGIRLSFLFMNEFNTCIVCYERKTWGGGGEKEEKNGVDGVWKIKKTIFLDRHHLELYNRWKKKTHRKLCAQSFVLWYEVINILLHSIS